MRIRVAAAGSAPLEAHANLYVAYGRPLRKWGLASPDGRRCYEDEDVEEESARKVQAGCAFEHHPRQSVGNAEGSRYGEALEEVQRAEQGEG